MFADTGRVSSQGLRHVFRPRGSEPPEDPVSHGRHFADLADPCHDQGCIHRLDKIVFIVTYRPGNGAACGSTRSASEAGVNAGC
jgi:hypothetical protein